MSESVTLRIRVQLLSDAIFGSGFSIPGGEDVAVCRDEAGYPYLKGTTLKGLLRESMENLIVWTDGDPQAAAAILGESGWDGAADGRRLHLTDLTLDAAQRGERAPEECFGYRTFTSLQDGIAARGTLRTAACVRRGLRFTGSVLCAGEDANLVGDALRGIKWAGTMRSRGFGRIRVEATAVTQTANKTGIKQTGCLHYILHTAAPVLMTDLSRSRDNSFETRGCFTGSSIRGMVISALAAKMPAEFAAHRAELLSEATRFSDAVPNPTKLASIPSLKGFYEDKLGGQFQTVVKDGTVAEGLKRAKLGTFCALDGPSVCFWSADTDGVTRIQRNVSAEQDSRPFQTRYLSAGQDFEGYVLLDNPALAPLVAKAFEGPVWLGADRFEGFGKCEVRLLEAVEMPGWIRGYGCKRQDELSEVLYLLAVSPFSMLNDIGEPCGIDAAALAGLLGVSGVCIEHCSTSISECGGYNRSWKCREPAVRMYDRGSLFKLRCAETPTLERVQKLQSAGVGIRRAEGYGQLLFLSSKRFERLTEKQKYASAQKEAVAASAATLRRAKCEWLERSAVQMSRGKLSASQLGSIQALCEKAIAQKGNTEELQRFLDKNRFERGAKHGNRFTAIAQFVRDVLENPLSVTLHTPCEGDAEEKLRLLCMLFDFCRKLGSREAD